MSGINEIKENIVLEINKYLENKDYYINKEDLTYPPNKSMGDISLPLFNLVKKIGKSPQQLQGFFESKINKIEGVFEFKVLGPYLNFFIDYDFLNYKILEKILKEKNKYGENQELKGKKIMIEFSQSNPFKVFHIGHLRNIILGESLCRLFEFSNAKVIRTNYQGDVGMHIAKCLWSFKEIEKSDYPDNIDERINLLGECYVKGAKAFEEDEEARKEIEEINKKIYSLEDKNIKELWETGKQWSLDKFKDIYNRLYTKFNREYFESEVFDEALEYIEEAKNKGILEKSKGAIIFPGEKYGLETKVFLNSKGLPTYDGKELGLAYREFTDFGKLDKCIHNVAVEQTAYFKANFKVQELLDPERFKDKQYHNAYEFVGLKKGKMSSRLGKVVLAEDVIDLAKEKIDEIVKEKESSKIVNNNYEDSLEKLTIGAIKYSFLKVSPFKYLSFDLDESINFNGDSSLYINYTYARIESILKKAKIKKINKKNIKNLTNEKEKDLILFLSQFSEIISQAREEYNPSEIAKYLFKLSQKFNDYYHEVSILKEEDENIKQARLKLLEGVSQVIENGVDILGFKLISEM
ncbi:arginine--tRNA ligase [bacterium]|nr:arginine--tRNA ligase [bacterium]